MPKRPGSDDKKAGRSTRKKRKDTVDLQDAEVRYNLPQVVARDYETLSQTLLKPLLSGRSVFLAIRDPKMPKKKRAANPVLCLVPTELIGLGGNQQLVAMIPGRGCEIIDLRSKIKPLLFYRLSLNATLSATIAEALNLVFNLGENHGV